MIQRILNKEPKKRPSLQDLKKDAFFADIDWVKLEKKEISPPQVLKKNGTTDNQNTNNDGEEQKGEQSSASNISSAKR